MTRLPSFDTGEFGLPPLPSLTPRPKKKTQLEFDPATQDTLARKAGRIAVGGISAAANLLDLPGSMVRDVIAGQNPVDQLLHPFSGESRTSGRDLARKMGLAGKQDNWKNFLGGLAIDVGTDPLTYVFPFGAMTKAGRIAKAANIGDEAMITAARKFGRPVGEIGKREAGLRTTLGDVFKEADFAGKRAAVTAARAQGVKIRDVMDDPLRGMFATGFMGKVNNVTGFGDTSQAIARKLDTLGSTIRYARVPGTEIEPVNAMARLFSAPLGDTKTRTIQPFARRMFNLKTGGRAAAMREMSGYVDELVKSGHATSAQADELRGWLEGTRGGQMAPELAPLVGKLQDRQVQIMQEAKSWGTDPKEWTSPYAMYWPRHATDRPGKAGAAAFSSFGANTPNAKRRLEFLSPFTDENGVTHAIRGETTTIKDILQDPDIAAAVTNRNSRRNIANLIEFKYGHLVPKKYAAKGGREGNRYLALAKWMERMDPDLKAAGMFGNHPLLDMQAELIGHNDAIGSAQTIRDMLVSPGMLKPASSDVRETVQVGRLLKILKIKSGDATEGFGRKLAEGLGLNLNTMPPDDANKLLKDLMGMRIDRTIAHDVLKFKKSFVSPEPVNEIVGLVDSITNLWKGLQTGVWPAFHVRNFVSGQYQNWVGNMFSRESVKDTWKLLRGEEIPGAASIPVVKQMAAKQGIANLTDKQATDMLGQLVYSHGLSHRFAGEHVNIQGALNTLNPATIEGAIQEIPGFGVNHIQPGRVARKAVAREAGTSLNPLASRGFMGQMESKFGPAAAGEELGGVIEAMNRIAPFLHQLKRGVDPVAAAQKVGAAQVMYQGRYYTKAEQQVLARMFPFYKFSSRMMPWTLRQLAEQPTGKLGTTLRAANRLRNPSVQTPDYVSETTAIPMGEAPDGSQRYLTGAGLMFEDPLSFFGGGVRGALLEAGSRLNPFIKGPLEWGTNQTFFQKGPMGGRNLEDLDPTIGRTLANLSGRQKPVTWPGSQGMEFAIANSPLSRATSTARALTYPVRALTDPVMAGQFGPELGRTAMNLLTGARVTSVSPASQEAMLRERGRTLMKGMGGKEFLRSYIPADVEAEMTPDQLKEAQALENLMNTLAARSKSRAEARKKAQEKK
jgi:hypothetical protein